MAAVRSELLCRRGCRALALRPALSTLDADWSLTARCAARLRLEDGSVSLTLHSPEKGAVPVTLIWDDPAAYPKAAPLVLSEAELPWLEAVTSKLAAGGRLSKAIRLLGAKLGMDLDWVRAGPADFWGVRARGWRRNACQ